MLTTATKYRIESVARAADLLCAFLQPPHRFGVTDLSAMTGLTKNQVFRILQTLMPSGFVVQDPETKAYRLGPRLIDLAAVAVHGTSLVHIAAPVLDQLAERTRETVVLTTRLDHHYAICIDKRESAQRLRITARAGARFALHAGSSPKLLLAYSPPESIEAYLRDHTPLPRYTERTITDPDALRAELERIRRQGYVVSIEELDPGVCSIAAPVHDHTGQVIAGISIAAPTFRLGPEQQGPTIEAVLWAGREISRRLAEYALGQSGASQSVRSLG
ncbi:IclR family transcriptional regulator [Sphaerobacter sp.]|uniref:IclR family transcriptional regulator n=1 Tax=Sphaerobacter sp. TaxID=2099654 RepID=UPI001DC53A03|nr:IclR family transcriptional regulator [Sphaerobacter sp.]MBX5446815.1 IclR family transcriptional regulator [Sphaerobacter sp.]